MFKRIVIIVIAVFLTISVFVYTSFQGLPWTKYSTSKEILIQLENKYNEPFVVNKRFYDFKYGNYGGFFSPQNNQQIEFVAIKERNEKNIVDLYHEEVWAQQFKQDLQDLVNKHYPDNIYFETFIGIYELEGELKDPTIPHYSEIDAPVSVRIENIKTFEETNLEWKVIVELIQYAQQQSKSAELLFLFGQKDDSFETMIICPKDKGKLINGIAAAKQFCEIN